MCKIFSPVDFVLTHSVTDYYAPPLCLAQRRNLEDSRIMMHTPQRSLSFCPRRTHLLVGRQALSNELYD